MNDYKPTEKQQTQFIWKDPLPCVVDFGNELRRIGLTNVVDLGCRVGNNSIALSEAGLRVTALDSSKENLKIVEGRSYDKNLNITTSYIESQKLPFQDDSIHAFVTTTAIHHSKPNVAKELVDDIYRVLIPGGRILVAVLSVDDYRYGTGTKIAENTFADTTGPEIKNIHQFFTEESLIELFGSFVPECKPYIVPSTFILDTEHGKKQGKMLVCKFMKGVDNEKSATQTQNCNDIFSSAKRSVELLFSYPNTNANEFGVACIDFLNSLSIEILNKISCQCVIVGNMPIDTVSILEKLSKIEHSNFSLAYSEQTNESQLINVAIIDGIRAYSSVNSELYPDSLVYDNNGTYINLFRQQINSCWKKSTVLIDSGKTIKQKQFLVNEKNKEEIASEAYVKVIDFKDKRKECIRIGVSQIDLNGILYTDNTQQLLKPDLMKLPNIIEHVLLKAANMNLNLLMMPELSGDESLNIRLQKISNANNMIIIGGSYYDQRRVNCCPVAIPGREEPYIVEKIHPSPVEISPNKNSGIVEGSHVIVFKNTIVGSFGVLICADFLNDLLLEEVCNKDIDFLCVVSMNNDSPRFFERMNLKCQNCQRGLYIFYSNCLFSTDGFDTDGLSSLFGFMDRLYLAKLKRNETHLTYQVSSFYEGGEEGLLVADININERRPKIRGPETKPNISNIEKIKF